MDTKTVHLIIEATIHDGRFAAFEAVARQMTSESQKEPGTRGYEWYLSADRKHCRLIETYADGAALLAHFKGPVVQQFVPQMLQLVSLDSSVLYGDPGEEGRVMMTGFGSAIFSPWLGLNR